MKEEKGLTVPKTVKKDMTEKPYHDGSDLKRLGNHILFEGKKYSWAKY